MKIALTIACGLALFASAAALAQSSFVGDYRLSDGPDVAGELILRADGRFQYALAAGALDEQAEGRWVEANGQVRLYTEPKPKPAVFAAGPQIATKDGPLKLLVTWPNGNGIAGVDVTIGFDSGPPVSDYTQDYGWTMPPDERRIPRWVELREPIHGVASPRFAIDVAKGNALTFVLTPNDLGTVDFDGTVVEWVGDRLVMHQRLGDATFVRARK
ncbi:MAG: hypothetical protein ABIQ43_04220 [Sphingomonas sp.]